MAGTVIGWFFLSLAALAALLLALPVCVSVRFAAGRLTVRARVLFAVFTLFPMKPKRPAKPPRKKRKPRPAAEKPGKTLSEQAAAIKRLAAAGKAALSRFLRHLRIKGVSLSLPVHAGDAAQTARRCGQIQTAIGTARALLSNRLRVRYRRLCVTPDWSGDKSGELSFSCKLVFCPGIMFPVGAAFLSRYLKGRRRRKPAAARTPTAPLKT